MDVKYTITGTIKVPGDRCDIDESGILHLPNGHTATLEPTLYTTTHPDDTPVLESHTVYAEIVTPSPANWILPTPEVFLGFLRPIHESSDTDPQIYFINLRHGGHRTIDCATGRNPETPLYYSEIPLRNIHYNYYLLYTEMARFEAAKFVASTLTFYNVGGICGTMFQYIDPRGIEHTKGYSQESWTRDIIPKELIGDIQKILRR